MKIQCGSCGFLGSFSGDIPPSSCPVCKRGKIEVVGRTTACFSCGTQFPSIDSACPACGVERISRYRSKENYHPVIPDEKKDA